MQIKPQITKRKNKCYIISKKRSKSMEKTNNEEIYKRLGLTEKSIEVLEDLKAKENKVTTNKRAFAKRIETINCLLENEANYGILGYISLFLWDEYKGVFEVLEINSGKKLCFTASKLQNTFMFDIEKNLNKLKKHLKDEKIKNE